MGKKIEIMILAVFGVAGSVAGSSGLEKVSQALLNDGFMLTGIDGKLSSSDSNDVWFFVLASDVNDGKSKVGANTALQLLPSSTLEKMSADMKQRSGQDYRIWARVTKYKGRNFLFPVYFLPLSKIKDLALAKETDANSVDTSQEAQIKPMPEANEPNSALAIPKAITDRLSDKPTVYRQQRKEPISAGEKLQGAKQDYILADRIGFISSCVTRDAYCEKERTHDAIRNTQYEFVLDGLGLSVQQMAFRLLPCQLLEQVEKQSAAGGLRGDQIRWKIAGIVTEYKGDKYLLLQRAIRTYSHGNFGR